jgi:hypothetical protein
MKLTGGDEGAGAKAEGGGPGRRSGAAARGGEESAGRNLRDAKAGLHPEENALGRILERIAKKEGISGKALKGRRLAAKILWDVLERAGVAGGGAAARICGLRSGIVTIEVENPALMQEMCSFLRTGIIKALNDAGIAAKDLRIRLTRESSAPGRRQTEA